MRHRHSNLNLDRQEHRALKELLHYLRLDPRGLTFEKSRGYEERWDHPVLGEIQLGTYDYDPVKKEYVGARLIKFHWRGEPEAVDYDVDGIIIHKRPRSVLTLRLEGIPGEITFDSMIHPKIAGKLITLRERVEKAWVNGEEIRDIGWWIDQGPFEPEKTETSIPVDFEFKLETDKQDAPPFEKETTYSEAMEIIEGTPLAWAKINGEAVDVS